MVRIRPALAALAAAALVALLLALRAAPDAPTTLALPAPGLTPPAPATSTPPATPTPLPAATRAPAPPSSAPPDLRAVLAALDRARAAAFADPVHGDPEAWAAPACPCHAGDARRLRALARAGHALRGHTPALLSVTVVRALPGSADLLVTDRLPAYAAVDRRGRTVARWPATGPRRWRLTLVLASGRWRIGAVARAP